MNTPGRPGPLLPFEFLWQQGVEFIINYFSRQVFVEHPFLTRHVEVVRRIRIIASAGKASKQEFREFYDLCAELIELDLAKRRRNPFAQSYDSKRLQQLAQGDILLGKLYGHTPHGFGVSEHAVKANLKAFYRGLLLLGSPGSGKSNLWAHIMTQLLPAAKAAHDRVTSFIFEGDKGTAVDLLFSPLQRAGIESLVVPDIQFNLLQLPTGVSAKKYADRAAAMLAEAYAFPFASRILLQKHIRRLYKEWRLDFQRERFPDLIDLKNQIEKDPTGGAARTNVLGKLEELELAFEDNILYSRALTGEDFVGESVFFPLGDYYELHKALLMQHFSVGEYERRKAARDFSPLFVSLEEAGPLVEPREARERRALVDLARVGREFNIGLIVIHQQAAKVDPSFFSLFNLIMLGNAKADDLAKGVRAAGFPEAHADWVRENIDDYQWATSCSSLSGRREPLLIGSLPVSREPAPPLDQIPNEKLKSIRLVKSADARRVSVQPQTVPQPAQNAGGLPAQALACLEACAHPDRPLKLIYEKVGVGPVRGSKIVKSLQEADYLETLTMKCGFKTWYKIPTLHEAALARLSPQARAMREAVLATTERGFDEHNHIIRRLAAAFARLPGIKVTIERKYDLAGRVVSVDVVVERLDGTAEAYEVEWSSTGENSSRKMLALPFSKRYLIVGDHDKVVAMTSRIAPIDPGGLIAVCTLADLGGFSPLPVFNGDVLIG
jgi:hypothetical protein